MEAEKEEEEEEEEVFEYDYEVMKSTSTVVNTSIPNMLQLQYPLALQQNFSFNNPESSTPFQT